MRFAWQNQGAAMKNSAKWLLLVALVFWCGVTRARAEDFAFGADFSFLPQAESQGKVFKDEGVAKPGLEIFREHHYNWARFRIFVEPVQEHLPNDLAYTLAAAKDAKKLGYKLLLDFHYASSWADPAKQPTPAQWRGLSHADRAQALYEYTSNTIAAFRKAGVLPEMVQPGNEITHGILWPDGRAPTNWDNFADYLRAGIKGVDAGRGSDPMPKILLQLAEDGKPKATQKFFDKIAEYKIPYDAIGFSYYPWWHGTLGDLRTNLAFAATRYRKPIFVAETAYYWRTNRETQNRILPFPETPEGQRDFLDEVTRTVMDTPDGLGQGVFWWEPAVTGFLGGRGFFDDSGNALPVMTVFDKYSKVAARSP